MTMTNRRVLIFGADGLRPDLIDRALMPNVARLEASGVRFADHHAVYPSHTRVNASTLSTGTTPSRTRPTTTSSTPPSTSTSMRWPPAIRVAVPSSPPP